MLGLGQAIDPMWAMGCMAQGGVPDPQLGCVPAPLYPAVRQCVDQGGTWDPYFQICIPRLPTGIPGVQTGLAETVARIGCAAMGAQWDDASKTCGGPAVSQRYGIDDFQSPGLPTTGCPPEAPVPTPMGCKPWPEIPPIPALPGVPGVQPAPKPAPPPAPPPAETKPVAAAAETPEWLVPAAVGVAAAAALALILSR